MSVRLMMPSCFAQPGPYFAMNGCRGCTWRTHKRRLALSPGRPLPGTLELSLSGAGDQRTDRFRRISPVAECPDQGPLTEGLPPLILDGGTTLLAPHRSRYSSVPAQLGGIQTL